MSLFPKPATLKRHGLTEAEFAAMLERQRFRCPICEQPFTETRKPVIDHNHRTGAFRGLLDRWCNHRVVSMAERGGPIRAKNAIRYLWGDAA